MVQYGIILHHSSFFQLFVGVIARCHGQVGDPAHDRGWRCGTSRFLDVRIFQWKSTLVVNPWKYWDLRPEKRVISWSHLIQHVQRNLPSGKQKKFAIEHGPVEMSWIYPLNMVDLSIVFWDSLPGRVRVGCLESFDRKGHGAGRRPSQDWPLGKSAEENKTTSDYIVII